MKNDLEKFIRDNREQLDSKLPPPGVLGRVIDEMRPEETPREDGVVIPFRVIRWVAAAIVLLAIGFTFLKLQQKPASNVTAIRTVVKPLPLKPGADTATKAPVQMTQAQPALSKSMEAVDRDLAMRKRVLGARLKGQNINGQKGVMFAGLNDMESPATRINATLQVYKLKDASDDVVDVLVKTLNTDPNPNVRLAALDGLARFYQETYVRKKLVASLRKQQDPLVEIALINLLTRIKESGTLSELEKIVHDENTDKPIKDCAYSGIMQLGSSI